MAVERQGFTSAIWNTSYNSFFGPPGESYRFIDPFTPVIINTESGQQELDGEAAESFLRFRGADREKRKELKLENYAVNHATRCVLFTANAINLDSKFITRFISVEPLYILEDGTFDPFWTAMFKYENGFEEEVKETHACMKYLCTKFVGSNCYLYPMADQERTYKIDLRMSFDLTRLKPEVFKFVSEVVTKKRIAKPTNEILLLLGEVEDMLTRHKFLVDDSISLADIAIVARITMLELANYDPSGQFQLIGDWLKRIKILPFYRLSNGAFEAYKQDAFKVLNK